MPHKGIIQEWISKSESDRKGAHHLLDTGDEELSDLVCFHSHAAVEKYLKAIIYFNTGTEPPHIHDLRVLYKKVGVSDNEVIDNCNWLNEMGIAFRYPGEAAVEEEAREAVERMEKALNALKPLLAEAK